MSATRAARRRFFLPITCLLLLSPLLFGHHPAYPAPLDFLPFGDQSWALITTSGFVVSDRPEELICKEAFGVEGRVYATAMGPTHFAVASNEGLAVTRDGCHLSASHPLSGPILDLHSQGEILIALEVHPDADALHLSLDGGDTLEHLLDLPADLSATTVKILSPSRAVIAAFDNQITTRGEGRLLFVDLPEGSFTEFIPAEPARFPFLFAVSDSSIGWVARRPVMPHLIWGPLDEPDRQSAELQYWPIDAGFDEADDIWLGGLDLDWEGAGKGSEEGFALDPRFDAHTTTCIVPDADGLWICSDGFAQGYELWRVDGDQDPQPFYRLSYLQGPRQCPPESPVARICPQSWELVRQEIARGDGTPALPPSESDSEEEIGSGDLSDDHLSPETPDWLRPPDGDLDQEPEPGSPSSPGGCFTRHSEGLPASLLVLAAFLGLSFRRRLLTSMT